MSAFGDAFTKAFEARDAERERERREDKEEKIRRDILIESRAYNERQRDELRLFHDKQNESDYQKSLARLQGEMDRVDSEKTFKLMANAPSGIAFDATTDPEEQVRKHNLFLDLQKRQAMAGMPVSKLKTANIGQPELPESLEPGDVTPEMEGELAEFIRGKGIEGQVAAFKLTNKLQQDVLGESVKARLDSLPPSQARVLKELYGDKVSDNPQVLAFQIENSAKVDNDQFALLGEVDKRNANYYNLNARNIPLGTMTYDAATGKLVPFKMRVDSKTGAYNTEDIQKMVGSLREVPPADGFPGPSKWVWDEIPPRLSGPLEPSAGAGVSGGPPVEVPRFGLGGRSEFSDEGTGEAAINIPMPGPLPPLESDSKEREFWEGRGVSRQTYEAARNAYNFDVGAGPFGREGRYSLPGPRPGSRGQVILPLIRGMGDINPEEESLFDSAMRRLSAQDAFLTKRIDPIDRRIQEIKGTGASPTYSKSLVLRQELARLLKDREPLSEKLSKVEELRNDLVWSFR